MPEKCCSYQLFFKGTENLSNGRMQVCLYVCICKWGKLENGINLILIFPVHLKGLYLLLFSE